jgi:hypothetical protein
MECLILAAGGAVQIQIHTELNIAFYYWKC